MSARLSTRCTSTRGGTRRCKNVVGGGVGSGPRGGGRTLRVARLVFVLELGRPRLFFATIWVPSDLLAEVDH